MVRSPWLVLAFVAALVLPVRAERAPVLSPEEMARQARIATVEVDAARRALLDQQPGKSKHSLDLASRSLRKLYTDAPGSAVVQQLSEAETRIQRRQPVDLRQVASRVDGLREVVSPQAVDRVHRAVAELQRGHRDDAVVSLRLARDQLTADLALLPVEDAWARVGAARTAIGQKDPALAQRMLGQVPTLLAEVSVRAPLVPIRGELTRAARAAVRGDSSDAERGLQQAASQLRAVEAVSEDRIAREVRPLRVQAEELAQRSEARRRVRPKDVRALAQSADALGRGGAS